MPYDAESEAAAVVVGSGTLLIQACALFPGLLPCLLLLLPLVLPLLVLGVVGAVLIGVPLGLWRLVSRGRNLVVTHTVRQPAEQAL